ncbi:MAG: hypothetical protein BGN88_07900 [Clostridiales bacterium 43-6]|nr:MAG: hypothetical protein BGN88_07900 [Clostridiales bacterium 43-6]
MNKLKKAISIFLVFSLTFMVVVYALPGQCSAASVDVVPINWSSFSGAVPTDPLAVKEKTILLNACKYALTTWYDERYTSQDSQQYLNFVTSGSGEHPRPLAAMASVIATAIKTGIYDATVTGVTLETAKSKAIKLLTSVAYHHKANVGGTGAWDHSASFTANIYTGDTAFAGWLLWEDISSTDREYIRNMLEYEANYLLRVNVPYFKDKTGKVLIEGDTKMEENAWNARCLQMAVCMMPNHPNYNAWYNKMVEYQLSSTARPDDLNSSVIYNGKPLSQWLNGSNINNDGSVINHNIIQPVYSSCIGLNVFSAYGFTLAGKSTPKSAFFNDNYIYSALTDLNYTVGQVIPDTKSTVGQTGGPAREPGGTVYREENLDIANAIYFPQGNDWNNQNCNFPSLDSIIQLTVDGERLDNMSTKKGEYWENLHAQIILNMQARFQDGRTFQTGENTYSGAEDSAATNYASAYMMKWLMANYDKFSATNEVVSNDITTYTSADSVYSTVENFEQGLYWAQWGQGPANILAASSEYCNSETGSTKSMKVSFTPSANGAVQMNCNDSYILNIMKRTYKEIDSKGIRFWFKFTKGDTAKYKASFSIFSSYTIPGYSNNFGSSRIVADASGWASFSWDKFTTYISGQGNKTFASASKADKDAFFAGVTKVQILFDVTAGVETTAFFDDVQMFGNLSVPIGTTPQSTTPTTSTTSSTPTTTTITTASTTATTTTATETTIKTDPLINPYPTENGYLWGISNGENMVDLFLSKFTVPSDYDIVIWNTAEDRITEGKFGSGAIVKITQNGTIVSQYIVILYGDVDGDGTIGVIDLLKIKKHILGMRILTGYSLAAADTDRSNDHSINAIDLLVLKKHLLKIAPVKQN